jgi:hypothetical protein
MKEAFCNRSSQPKGASLTSVGIFKNKHKINNMSLLNQDNRKCDL